MKNLRPLLILAFSISAFSFFLGCASHKSTVMRRTDRDGNVTELTRSATRTFFESRTRLADSVVRSQLGANVQEISIGSLAQEATASNFVATARIAGDTYVKATGLGLLSDTNLQARARDAMRSALSNAEPSTFNLQPSTR